MQVSAYFTTRTITSWVYTSAVRNPLTAVQAATASCFNYHCRHVGHIHYLTLRVRHLLLPILWRRLPTLRHGLALLRLSSSSTTYPHGGTAPSCFPTTSSSGTPTAGVTSAAALKSTYVTGDRNLRRHYGPNLPYRRSGFPYVNAGACMALSKGGRNLMLTHPTCLTLRRPESGARDLFNLHTCPPYVTVPLR